MLARECFPHRSPRMLTVLGDTLFLSSSHSILTALGDALFLSRLTALGDTLFPPSQPFLSGKLENSSKGKLPWAHNGRIQRAGKAR